MKRVNATELEQQFHIEAEMLKNGITTILQSGPLACVSAFGGCKENYIGSNSQEFLYKTLSSFTIKRWNDFSDELEFPVIMAEDNYQQFVDTYLNPKAVKPFVREEINNALQNALNEPKERVKERLRQFLAAVATSDDFSYTNSTFTYRGYFSLDRKPKGFSDLKTFLVDVKNATDSNFDLATENKQLRSLDIIEKPNVNLFNDQIQVKGFKSGKVTIRIAPKIGKNLDRFLGI